MTSIENFLDNVDWIFWFVNAFKSKNIWVIKISHHSKFINETFLSVFSGKCVLFWKSFDCKFFEVGQSFNFINRSEISFSEFSYWFEKFVEASLVDKFWKVECPTFNDRQVSGVETIEFSVWNEKLKSDFLWMYIFLNKTKFYLFNIQSFEFQVKVYLSDVDFLWLVWLAAFGNDMILSHC